MATGFRNLTVYKKAFALAMDIYHVSKKFPKDELYSLTTQIRKSSRSVCSNIGEGYRKRLYEAHFVSKISDSDIEVPKPRFGLILHLPVNIYLKNAKYNEISHYQAINIELSPDGYRGDLMIRQAESKFRYIKILLNY